MKMSDGTAKGQEPTKKIRILDLMPEKTPIPTSLGTLYVRHIYVSDWKHLERNDSDELGKAIVGRVTSRLKDKGDDTALSDDDFAALVSTDFDVLAPAIAAQCGWGALPEMPALEALGQLAKTEKEKIRKQFKKQTDDMRKSVEGAYGFLGKDTLEKLTGQLKGLADIREAFRLGSSSDALKNSLMGTDAYIQAARYSDLSNALKGIAPSTQYDEVVRAAAAAAGNMGSDFSELSKAAKASTQYEEMARTAAAAAGNMDSDFLELQPSLEIHVPRMPPRPEETPVGKAAVATALHAEEIARLMAVLTDATAGLNQTVVTEILPAWFKQVENDTRAGNASLSNAAESLWWAKWAIGLSILTTIFTTWWQISVTREIDGSNNKQQQVIEDAASERHDAVEALLKREIAMQEALIQRQADDAEQLRAVIRSMEKSRAPTIPTSQIADSPKIR